MKGKTLKVIKRDGTLEDFDEGKIKKIAIAAGLEESAASILAEEVKEWAGKKKNSTVTSLDIRDKVAALLKKADDYAYKKFIWWQGYKSEHFAK